MSSNNTDSSASRPMTEAQWRKALDDLPDKTRTNGKIPSIFLAHGQPGLIWPSSLPRPSGPLGAIFEDQGPDSRLANFLRDLGPALIKKYDPFGIVVFSAHWETSREILVTDYGAENPLLYDFYGFDKELYQAQFKSPGDSKLSAKVVSELKNAGIQARTTSVKEPRGRDGRGFRGSGFDHGVFVPFKLMFGESTTIPIVEVSLDESLDIEKNWALGKALQSLRSQGILIISGGLTIHTFEDFTAFAERSAKLSFREWHESVLSSIEQPTSELKNAISALKNHPGFRLSHPREEHFVPLYIAAGAGEGGTAKTLAAFYGAPTFIFGL